MNDDIETMLKNIDSIYQFLDMDENQSIKNWAYIIDCCMAIECALDEIKKRKPAQLKLFKS